MNENCDLKDVLKTEDKVGEKIVYGKRMLTSHRNYNLWNEERNIFNVRNMERMYGRFLDNMIDVAAVFKTKWVNPNQLLTTSKQLIWDWTDNEEKMKTAKDILENGVYFPIFTLDKGLLHNQIITEEEADVLKTKNLYNSYNGNHRIDVMHYWQEQGKWDKEVLIYIIPEFCQKSCTGFKYDFIDDHDETNPLVQYKLPHPIRMYHLDRLEHEMKVSNWREREEVEPGLSIVMVDNYNVAFRIMTEFQNALEAPLVNYYKTYGNHPWFIEPLGAVFNDKELFEECTRWK